MPGGPSRRTSVFCAAAFLAEQGETPALDATRAILAGGRLWLLALSFPNDVRPAETAKIRLGRLADTQLVEGCGRPVPVWDDPGVGRDPASRVLRRDRRGR